MRLEALVEVKTGACHGNYFPSFAHLCSSQVVESAEVTDESLLEAGDVLENMMSLTQKTGAKRKVATSILGAVDREL